LGQITHKRVPEEGKRVYKRGDSPRHGSGRWKSKSTTAARAGTEKMEKTGPKRGSAPMLLGKATREEAWAGTWRNNDKENAKPVGKHRNVHEGRTQERGRNHAIDWGPVRRTGWTSLLDQKSRGCMGGAKTAKTKGKQVWEKDVWQWPSKPLEPTSKWSETGNNSYRGNGRKNHTSGSWELSRMGEDKSRKRGAKIEYRTVRSTTCGWAVP